MTDVADVCIITRVFQEITFFEFWMAIFFLVHKCYIELSEKIWGQLEVIWPPHQPPFFLANIRKWNFWNILKTHHMIHHSTQNLMLISEMYRVIGLFFGFYFFVIFNTKMGPFFQKFKKRAVFSIKNHTKNENQK